MILPRSPASCWVRECHPKSTKPYKAIQSRGGQVWQLGLERVAHDLLTELIDTYSNLYVVFKCFKTFELWTLRIESMVGLPFHGHSPVLRHDVSARSSHGPWCQKHLWWACATLLAPLADPKVGWETPVLEGEKPFLVCLWLKIWTHRKSGCPGWSLKIAHA